MSVPLQWHCNEGFKPTVLRFSALKMPGPGSVSMFWGVRALITAQCVQTQHCAGGFDDWQGKISFLMWFFDFLFDFSGHSYTERKNMLKITITYTQFFILFVCTDLKKNGVKLDCYWLTKKIKTCSSNKWITLFLFVFILFALFSLS